MMGPIEFFSQPLWQRWAFSLMHFLWQGAAITFLLVVLLKILNIQKASTRYSILLCGMLFMAVCPVVTFSVIEIPQTDTDESSFTEFDDLSVSNSEMNPLLDPFLEEDFLTENGVGPDFEDASAMLAPKQIRQPSWIQKAQPYLLFGWMAGVFVLSLRLLMSVIGMQGMKQDRYAVSAELLSRVRSLAANLGFRSVPRIYVTRRIQEAVVIGFFRPIILLPAAWLMELSPDVLEAVIAHELSHLRRWDLWVNLFQRFVEPIFLANAE
jgi:beta-lactamase regulating signal transducer with metallopeptidase domain